MKNFITMSKDQARRYTYTPVSEDYIIISINDTTGLDCKPPRFNRNSHLKDVLYLYFDDFEELPEECEDYVLMSTQDAFNIIQFIDKYSNINNIIIHCTAGVSRSVSIKCALEKCYNDRIVGKFIPNELLNSDEIYKLNDLLKEVEREKKNKIVWIHNKTCYEKTKFAYNYIRLKEKYNNRPDLFAEEFLGVKLLPYQKLILRSIYKRNNINLFKRRG